MSPAYTLQVAWNLVLVVLFLSTYAYLDKLEKMGCACADHPYRKFIKNFPLFAVAYIVLFLFLSPSMIFKNLGTAGKVAMDLLVVLFGLASIVFFVLALVYVRYLVREKCKCSEDVRRDILYVWSVIQIFIIVGLVVLMLLSSNILGNIGGTVNLTFRKTSAIGHGALEKPVESVRKLSKSLPRFK